MKPREYYKTLQETETSNFHEVKDMHCNSKSHTSMQPSITHPTSRMSQDPQWEEEAGSPLSGQQTYLKIEQSHSIKKQSEI